ncbi:MAG: Cys/Met metabolism pyridoxal-phosphate-dependent protein [Planctomycetota bacterium]|nr:MAG: Cys/Met metabolism pyridoxal-phosphate-dependent protein [Planctomycetota bacterium]
MSTPSDETPEDICPRPSEPPSLATAPLSPPIHLASVYRCESPAQADRILGGDGDGYVYARDGHPNADLLAAKCRELHAADHAAIAASGMAALALAVLAHLQTGDHVVASRQLYGKSLALLEGESGRLGIMSTRVDTCNLNAVRAALTERTRLIVVETITNPILRVSDLGALADMAHERGAALLVDNTLAGPVVCRPHEFGADFVLESLTKSMNGHSDVVLGLLTGKGDVWRRVPGVLSAWGLASSPFDCWLALRGLSTHAIRAEKACHNALAIARWLAKQPQVETVHYAGLIGHPDYALARRQFGERFGSMVTITLRHGRAAAESFIASARDVPFCPSLGELSTTLSHPQSTSHRGLTESDRVALGIFGGTIRLSIGIESVEHIQASLAAGLARIED